MEIETGTEENLEEYYEVNTLKGNCVHTMLTLLYLLQEDQKTVGSTGVDT